MTRSFLRPLFEVNFCPILKRLHRCKGIVISYTRMTCLRKSDKKWLHDNCLKLVDASTSQSIDSDAGDAGQSTRCSMSIATHNDFDLVHEMVSVSLAIKSKKNGLRSFSRD